VILHIRIDNRLLHGQVVQFWMTHLEIENLIVADDMAVSNPSMVTLYQMAVPRHVKLSVVNIVDLTQEIKENQDKVTLVLFSDIFDLSRAVMTGFDFKKIILGNIHMAKGRHRVTDAVYSTPEETEQLYMFFKEGKIVEIQTFPGAALTLAKDNNGDIAWLRA
jgi:PTS system mannose-specific IIB component